MNLVGVYHVKPASKANHILYDLLKERTPEQSISHKELPSFTDHVKFVNSRPYQAWYLIQANSPIATGIHENEMAYVGACYLTKQREIGVFIFNNFRGYRYGKQAVQLLMEKHPGKFLANVNPKNEPSIKLWSSLDFKHIQNTYANQ